MTLPKCWTPFLTIKAHAAILALIKRPGIVGSLSACAVKAVVTLVLAALLCASNTASFVALYLPTPRLLSPHVCLQLLKGPRLFQLQIKSLSGLLWGPALCSPGGGPTGLSLKGGSFLSSVFIFRRRQVMEELSRS